jgi:FkbM family methyltransferase
MSLNTWILARTRPAYRQKLTDIKNAFWGGYRHSYYSQFGEDVILGQLLPHKKGFYVDVGANHPKRYSNTQLLYERGWHGINIEPSVDAIKQFERTRTRDINLACGVSNKNDSLTYHRFSDPAFNTFSKETAEALHQKKWLVELESQQVEVLPLADILNKHLPHNTQIDFLSVDTEGHDLEALKSNDWSRFTPKVIAVEDHDFDPEQPSHSHVYQYLKERGYQLKAHVGPTLIVKHTQ